MSSSTTCAHARLRKKKALRHDHCQRARCIEARRCGWRVLSAATDTNTRGRACGARRNLRVAGELDDEVDGVTEGGEAGGRDGQRAERSPVHKNLRTNTGGAA